MNFNLHSSAEHLCQSLLATWVSSSMACLFCWDIYIFLVDFSGSLYIQIYILCHIRTSQHSCLTRLFIFFWQILLRISSKIRCCQEMSFILQLYISVLFKNSSMPQGHEDSLLNVPINVYKFCLTHLFVCVCVSFCGGLWFSP